MMPFRAALLAAASAYPMTVAFGNPGAETGDTSNWTQTVGTGFDVQTGDPYSGTYSFVLSTDSEFAEVKADPLDVPSAAETDIDAGTVRVRFGVYRQDYTGDLDYGRARMEFFDDAEGAGNFLGAYTTNVWDQRNSYAISQYTWNVPPGTRSVVLYIWGQRLAGTELSFYWDDVQDLSYTNDGNCEYVYADRGADITGWTVNTGTGQPVVNTSWSEWAWPGITPGSQSSYNILKDIDITTLSAAAQAAIAAGTATLHLHRYAWNQNDDDKSGTHIYCLDSGGSIVATAEDAAAASTNWGNVIDVVQNETVAIPTTTTDIRVRHRFDRVDGTVLDAVVGFVGVWITW